ncbi:MAG TPA: hypothetical protein VFN75_00200 [Pseudonocardiaceae bacterium]|nr:hypothetical protein [Pseudonocardiaceae bacterium]
MLGGSDAPAGQVGSGHVTPGMLAQLPAPLRDAYQAAITSGVRQVFLWAALIAVLGLIAAAVIQEVPLRGSEPAASRVAVASEPVRHEIVLREFESVPAELPQLVSAADPPSWRKAGLVLMVPSALIAAITFALWPVPTNSSTTASAAPATQAPIVVQNQDPAVPRPEDTPATTAVSHRLPPAPTPTPVPSGTTDAQVLILRDTATRWQPTPTPAPAVSDVDPPHPPAQQQTDTTSTGYPRCPSPAASPAATSPHESSHGPSPVPGHVANQGWGRGEPPCGWYTRPAN